MTLQSVQITGCVDASKLPVYDDIVLRDAVINTSSRFVSRNLPSSRRFLTDTAGSSVSEQSSNSVTANHFRHCRFEDCLRAGPARYTAPRTSPFSLFLHPLQRLVLFLLIFFYLFFLLSSASRVSAAQDIGCRDSFGRCEQFAETLPSRSPPSPALTHAHFLRIAFSLVPPLLV